MNYPPGIPDHICEMFEKLTMKAKRAGMDKYSARAILHAMRWEEQVERGDIDFKVNNNYSARLARWLMKKRPGMLGFFNTREREGHNMRGYRNRNDI